jgi:hypothetical protein
VGDGQPGHSDTVRQQSFEEKGEKGENRGKERMRGNVSEIDRKSRKEGVEMSATLIKLCT